MARAGSAVRVRAEPCRRVRGRAGAGDPTLGDLRLDQIGRPLLERILSTVPGGPSTRKQTHALLAMLLRAAVEDGLLVASPHDRAAAAGGAAA